MPDQTVFATSDVHIFELPFGTREGDLTNILKPTTPNRSNVFFRFDVSSLAGKMWDSVVLRLTYSSPGTFSASGAYFLSRVLQPMVFNQVTQDLYSTGNSWNADWGETSVDNDHTTRVDQLAQIVGTV